MASLIRRERGGGHLLVTPSVARGFEAPGAIRLFHRLRGDAEIDALGSGVRMAHGDKL
jgi:hypothetical protein